MKHHYVARTINRSRDSVLYYTGRAGEFWTSDRLVDAFRYDTIEGVNNFIARANRYTKIHGLKFEPVFVPGMDLVGYLAKGMDFTGETVKPKEKKCAI